MSNKSNRKTPWDQNKSLTPLQEFIKSNYLSNYNYKHPKLIDTNEKDVINSFELYKCKHCDSENIRKKGLTKNGIQRYICNYCNKSFTPITNTVFENHKVSIVEWLEFCYNIITYQSITASARNNKNAFQTSKFWIILLFDVLKDYQESIVLNKIIYIDETFYSIIYSEKQQKDGKFLRGLSKDKFCIGIGCDQNRVYARVEGKGKTSKKRTKETFISHIKAESTLIHDQEKAHNVLVEELKLKNKSYNSKILKGLKDKENPLYKINHQCFLLKEFLDAHSGFNRDNLQDYLNLFCFIQNPPHTPLEKIEILLNLAMSNPKLHTYRELFLDNKGKNDPLCK